MGKVVLSNPQAREVKDLASPTVVRAIWADAAEAVRKEAPAVQRRRRRTTAKKKS